MKRSLSRIFLLFSVACFVIPSAFATYDPSAGKWISRDPLGEQGGINLTQFCRNDPVNNIDPLGLRNEPANTLSFTLNDPSAQTDALYPDKRWGDRDYAGGRLPPKPTSLEEVQEAVELFVVVAGDGSEMVVGTLWAPAGWAFDARDMSHAIGDIKRGAFVSGSICVVATGIGYLPAGDIIKKPVLRLVNWIRRSSKAGVDDAVEKLAKEMAEDAAKDGWVRKGVRLTKSYGPTVPKGNYYENYEQINWAAKTPALSPKVAATFEGTPTYGPVNQTLYRAEDAVNSTTYGRWYGLAKPDSAATAEQMYNAAQYGNDLTQLSTYKTLPNAMGWVGKVKDGIGYQVYFDVPRVNVSLQGTVPLPQAGF